MDDASTDLSGRSALVTGAGSGLGRAGALRFARLGARVMIADLDDAGAGETARLVTDAGGFAATVRCDITNEAEVAAMVEVTVDTCGGLDAVWNNAGNAFGQHALVDMPLAAFEQSITTNLTGVFLCLKHELRYMAAHGGGAIVNTASGAARVPAPGRAPYSAAKRGVVALTAQAASEHRHDAIRVNAVLPGLIDTPGVRANYADDDAVAEAAKYVPGGTLGRPADVAAVVAWLCSDAARYVNGQALVVDGGGILA